MAPYLASTYWQRRLDRSVPRLSLDIRLDLTDKL